MANKEFSELKEKMLNKVIKKVEDCKTPTDIDLYYLGILSSACSKYGKDKNFSGFIGLAENFPVVFQMLPNLVGLVQEDCKNTIKKIVERKEVFEPKIDEDEQNWQKAFNELVGVIGSVKGEDACNVLIDLIDELYYSKMECEV